MEQEESHFPTGEPSQKDTVEEAEETQGNKDKSKAVRQARVEAKPYDVDLHTCSLEKASTTAPAT